MTRLQLALLAAAGSAALLIGAFTFQALGYAPCKMCLWQRWPHLAALLVGFAFWAFGMRWLLWLGALSATLTAGVGAFHMGVEQRWWEGPSTCTSGSTQGLTPDELLERILNAPVVRCDEIAWQFAGVSMAGWNAVLSLLLAAIWVTAAMRQSD